MFQGRVGWGLGSGDIGDRDIGPPFGRHAAVRLFHFETIGLKAFCKTSAQISDVMCSIQNKFNLGSCCCRNQYEQI